VGIREDLLPVSAILLVIVSMASVDILIIGEPLRALSATPIGIVLLLWIAATLKVRRRNSVR
jgi:arginine exporter protein ArgO